MKFGVYGCRHLHLEMAVDEMLNLGHECVGIYEPEGPMAKYLITRFE